MAGFGGSVKLKGESEYRRALTQITQSLKVVSSEMKATASSFESGDKSQEDLAKSSKDLKSALDTEKTALSSLKGQLATMQAEYNKTGQRHQELVNKYNQEKAKLDEIKSKYGETSNEYRQQQKVVDELAQEVKSSAKAYDAQGRALNNMKIRTANAETTVNRTAMALEKLGNEAQTAGNKAESASSGGFTVMKGALANLAGNLLSTAINGIQNLAGEAVSSSDSLKKFESTMQFAGYNGAQIKQAKADMKDYADKTVYDLSTVSNTTAQLAANGVPNYEKLTEAAGNLNAVAGGNQDTFSSVAMVLTQTAGAGKLTTENWNQLADAIPGASGKLQEALLKNGAYTGNFREALEKGEITADEFNKAIMDLGFTDAAQKAATSTDTFEGAMGNMQAAVVDGLMQIYDAIGSENITGFINMISDTVSAVIPPIKDAVSWFMDNLPSIAPMLAGIATGLVALLVADKIHKLTAAFDAWKVATEGETLAQKLLNAAEAASPHGLLIAGIAALVAGLVVLWNTNEGFRNFVTNAWKNIKDTIVNVATAVSDFVVDAWNAISDVTSNAWDGIVSITTSVWNGVLSAISGVINAMVSFVSSGISNIQATITSIWNAISSVTTSVWNAVKTAVTTSINVAKSTITSVVNGIRSTVTSGWNAIKSATSSAWNAIKTAIITPIQSARQTVNSIVSGIKNTVRNIFAGIKPRLNLSLPHVSVNGGQAPWGIGGKGRLPSFGVTWSALGGVFDKGARILTGVGEDGAEAVVPLEHNTQWIRRVADQMRDSLSANAVSTPEPTDVDYNSIVDAFKEALSEMKIEMDDEEMGKFVDRTVTRLVYE